MAKKLFGIAIIWGAALFAYIILGFTMPAHSELIAETQVSLNATANMTHFPGTYEMVSMYPVYIWFLPGICAIIISVIFLKTGTR